jgi:MFS family permease
VDGTDEPRTGLELHGWLEPPVIALALMALASGFGQFGAVTALGDVAKAFGHVTHGATVAEQAGLSGTELGVGLAILRLASLGGLPLAGLADRFGRRTMLLYVTVLGLAFTVIAAASPSYWWFVVVFALGRPLLSATNALSQVGAAEETRSSDRAKAIALIAAGYGVGSGVTALLRDALGFRGVFALSAVPLLGVFVVRHWLAEPSRFTVRATYRTSGVRSVPPVLGAVGPAYRWRLLVVATLAFSLSIVTGPANSFVYIYAENVLKMSGFVIGAMVVVAGLFGLVGLIFGRWLADRFGRRPTGAVAMVAMALTGVLTYTGSHVALLIGYELGVLSASTFAPAAGALANELFPTSVRASVAGWYVAAGVLGAVVGLLVFGSVAEVANRFGVAAAITFLPVILTSGLFLLLPETRGREPEELWPETS